MSPDGRGDLIQTVSAGSGPIFFFFFFCSVWPASPLLWTNGRRAHPVTEILQKGLMWDACSFSHRLLSVTRGTGGGDGVRGREGGRKGGVSLEWTASHTCWSLKAAYVGGRECGFFSLFMSNITPLSSSGPPPSPLKCAQSKASVSDHTSHHYFVLFKTVKCEIWWVCIISVQTKGLGGGCCGTSCVDFSYTTLFQLCENKMTFVTKIKRNKNNHNRPPHSHELSQYQRRQSTNACNTKGIKSSLSYSCHPEQQWLSKKFPTQSSPN